jgi:negative regulator of flagellin synthesis FlgM
MPNKITGFTRPTTENRPAGAQSSGATGRNTAADARETPASRQDAVSLTDTATRLKSIEARLSELPDVDQARVDHLRQLIANGEFEIDAKLIAQRLAELEQLLF